MPKVGSSPSFKVEQIGECQMVLGDYLKYMPNVPWHSIDLVIADPPYGINYKSNYSSHFQRSFTRSHTESVVIANDDGLEVIRQLVPHLTGKVCRNGGVYLFCSPKNIERVLPIVHSSLLVKNLLVWDKGNWTLGDLECGYGFQYEQIIYAVKERGRKLLKRRGDVFRVIHCCKRGDFNNHPNQKPVKLISALIENTSNIGDLIFDPFLGGGVVAECCVRLGRRFIGCEIDPKFYARAVGRVKYVHAQLGYSI